MATNKTDLYRYPGTKPFETNEYELFKGRDDDIRNLYDLISLQNQVVLFGRSGLGKSSLLNAGLLNWLMKEPGIVPLFLRFGMFYNQNATSPSDKIHATIRGEQTLHAGNFIEEKLIPENEITEHRLWYAFKRYQITKPETRQFVLIFDQFEELFTYPQPEIDRFKKELSELLYVSVPQQLRDLLKEKLRTNQDYLTPDEKDLLFRPLTVKALFSIRADKLSLLNNLTDYFTSILNICYELKPLQMQQARQAIEEPAKLTDRKYATPPFTFTEDAINVLLDSLTTVAKSGAEGNAAPFKQDIETFQLQIVCKHAENLVQEKGLRQITVADLGNIKEMFENHYRNIISKLKKEDQLPARRLIEEKLIVDGTRVSMPIPVILKDTGMSNRLLDELIDTHILRREQNNTVELSHDTLIEPVLKYYQERKKEEDIAAEVRRKEEEIKRIQEQRERDLEAQKLRAKRTRILVAVISIALILSLGMFAYALKKSKIAEQERASAIAQRNRADSIASIATADRLRAEKNAGIAMQEKARADINALQAEKALKFAQSQQEIAFRNAEIAAEKAELAIKASREAEAQKEVVTKSGEAFRLITLARQVAETNPTAGMRIADEAMKKKRDTIIEKEARKLFAQQAFYQTIVNDFHLGKNITRDGNMVFTRDNGILRLWNTDGALIKEIKTSEKVTEPVAFSADRKTFLTNGSDSVVRLWDINGNLLKEFPIQSWYLTALALSRDGSKIVVGGSDSTLYLWDSSGSHSKKIKARKSINYCSYSPDGSKLLTGSVWTIPQLRDSSGSVIREFTENGSSNFCGTFSPNGEKILLGNLDSTTKLWTLNGELIKTFKTSNGVRSVAFSPDGTKILAGLGNGNTEVWQEDGTLLKIYKGNTGDVRSVAFTPDADKILTNDGTIKVWTVEEFPLEELKTNDKDLYRYPFVFSPDLKKLLAITEDSKVELYHLREKMVKQYDDMNNITQVAFSPDGKTFLTGSSTGVVQLWNLDGKLLQNYEGSNHAINVLGFSPDGTKIVTGYSSNYESELQVWAVDGKLLKTIQDQNGVYEVAFSPGENSVVISGGHSHRLTRYMRQISLTDTLVKEYKDVTENIGAVVYSPDRTKILTGDSKGTLTFWNAEGTRLYSFTDKKDDFNSGINTIAFSPGAKKILSGHANGDVKLWQQDGKLIYTYKGSGPGVNLVAFSVDGTKVRVGYTDGAVKEYNTAMSLEEALQSEKIERLTPQQKKEFNILEQ